MKTIDLLGEAGLNLWMITGDKAETAVAIGRMCGLLKQDHELELLLKLSGIALKQRLDDLVRFVDKSKNDERSNSRVSFSPSLTQILRNTFGSKPTKQKPSVEIESEGRISDATRDSMIGKTENLLKKGKNKGEGEFPIDHSSPPANQFLPSNYDEDSKSNTASFRSATVSIVLRSLILCYSILFYHTNFIFLYKIEQLTITFFLYHN